MTLNSISDALSGLQANQEYMNVIGNNIANVNTTGYKTQEVRFEDMLNQTLSYGTVAQGGLEGTDPTQVGMGVGNSSIDLLNTQGTVQSTGRLTDMAIQGGGYFVLSNGQQNYFTRDGSFTVAPDGTLESASTGMKVMGWTSLNTDGTVNTGTPLSAIQVPVDTSTATATSTVSMGGNLDATQGNYVAPSGSTPASGGQFQTTITVYDAQGVSHTLDVTFQKTSPTAWSYSVTDPTASSNTPDIKSGLPATGTVAFTADGQYDAANSQVTALALTFQDGANGVNSTSPANITLDFSKITQLAETSAVNVTKVDGTPGGTISTFNVDKNGVISAIFSNGDTKVLGQMAMANFRNPDSLQRDGDNLYAQGLNSGAPQYGQGGQGTMGTINTGQLEGSNVDLATQFAQMIQAQQGFNANAKVVTTSDQMLQSVIGIIP